jgi:hypothetical protein
VEELELCDMSEREKRGKSIRMFAGSEGYTRTSNGHVWPATRNGERTFEGRTLAALTLPQKKDPDVGAALFKFCALYAKLLIDGIADLFG